MTSRHAWTTTRSAFRHAASSKAISRARSLSGLPSSPTTIGPSAGYAVVFFRPRMTTTGQ
ncbi:hypothetical protein [Amycolatopsis regifaucium]|uniref:hypothetical protein n=1 Tax=Amycolatopsis regifaucium TaxID=546365 RepID=UPI001FD04128|nr:hypothetical protein [Amycolatopsis regifaucium]